MEQLQIRERQESESREDSEIRADSGKLGETKTPDDLKSEKKRIANNYGAKRENRARKDDNGLAAQ